MDISKSRSVILYRSEVDISAEGVVSNVIGDSVKQTEKTILDKLRSMVPKDRKTLKEITLLGGVVIHRMKTGVDRGKDFFQPLSIKTYTAENCNVMNLYKKAFGDLLMPRELFP